MENSELNELFGQARRRLPQLTQGTSPLGVGSFGLVVDHHDGSVSKLYFRHDDLGLPIDPAKSLATELRCLSRLARQPFAGLHLPSLVAEPVFLDDEQFQATVRMTKLPGRQIDWPGIGDRKFSADEQAHYYRSAGRLLARFHAVALQAELVAVPEPIALREIAPIAGADAATGRAFARAVEYRRASHRAGIAYGNLDADTMFVDDDLSATGIADLGAVRQVENVYNDFTDVPVEGLRDFAAGYGEESGVPVAPEVAAIENAIHFARRANRQTPGSANWHGDVLRVRQHLDEARAVTGYRLHF